MKTGWFYLDPDNRKKVPEGTHCIRCMKKIKDESKAIKVEYKYDGAPLVRESINGTDLIGKDCWNEITK